MLKSMIGLSAKTKGFTIVELLVVVAIFGLLIAMVLTNITETRARSRDARREQGIKSLQTALASYVSGAGSYYPVWSANETTFQYLACVDTNEIFSQLKSRSALDAVICDPLNTSVYRYEYRTADSAGNSYEIRYSLETDSISGKSAGIKTVSP